MALRGKKPEAIEKRLKMFVFGEAGVGKTTAALQFKHAYVIDTERGAENYPDIIAESKSVLFQTSSMVEVIAEVRALLVEKHSYRTLIIDPITPLYTDLLETAEETLRREKPDADPTAFGRHYGLANKTMKRLMNMLLSLDMNVIMTSHAKTEYGDDMKKLGTTFDAWRKASYAFDLFLHLFRQGKSAEAPRLAMVTKTRLKAFPDQSTFEWSYDEFAARYGKDILEREAAAVELASAEQVATITKLVSTVKLEEGAVEKWWKKAKVDRWEDMPADAVAKCIEYIKTEYLGDA